MRISVCPICGKIFEKNGGFHHVKWCKDKKEFLTIYELNSSNLEEKLNEIGSVLAFREKYPFKSWFKQYYTLFSEFGINTSIKRASNLDSVKNKRKNTSIINTGESHNFNKNHPSRKKWENKLYLEEGITNVFQREGVKLRSIKSFVEKYKTEKWKHALTVRGKGVVSGLNKKIFIVLEELNISFHIEFKILKDRGNSYYSYDILLNNNKIIEINGDYWHCNPLIYKPNDLFLKGTRNEITALKKWEKDKEKIDFAKEKGFNVLIIWEKEINEDLENVKNKIIDYEKS